MAPSLNISSCSCFCLWKRTIFSLSFLFLVTFSRSSFSNTCLLFLLLSNICQSFVIKNSIDRLVVFCLTSHSRILFPNMANITHFNALDIYITTYVHEYALSVIEKHSVCLIVRCTTHCLLKIENFITKSIEFQKCWVPLVLVFQPLLLVFFSSHPKPFEACVLTQSSSWSPKYAPTPFSLLIRTYIIFKTETVL